MEIPHRRTPRRRWLRSATAALVTLVCLLPGAAGASGAPPRPPAEVIAAAGAGSATVHFTAAPGPPATRYTVVSHPEGARVEGSASPLTIVGLAAGRAYTFTVTAHNSGGSSTPSTPSAAVSPTGPVTNLAPLATDRTFVNQTISFHSRTAGAVSSRRPITSDVERPSNGVPPGREWRLLWLRATNCESGARNVEFFTFDAIRNQTTRLFVEGRSAATPPLASVAVAVPAGGSLGWTAGAEAPLLVPAGSAVGARWLGMTGEGGRCSWQLAAIEQPAGTAAAGTTAAAPVQHTGAVTGSFFADVAGTRASWRTVPSGSLWVPRTVTASNCESGTRVMEVLLLGPGRLHHGGLAPAGAEPMGLAQVAVEPGQQLTWDAAGNGTRLLLPEGWSIGVRWHDMVGTAPSSRCSWSATLGMVPAPSLTASAIDALVSRAGGGGGR